MWTDIYICIIDIFIDVYTTYIELGDFKKIIQDCKQIMIVIKIKGWMRIIKMVRGNLICNTYLLTTIHKRVRK